MGRPQKYVVDTNVPLCANGQSHVSAKCVSVCARKIGDIQKRGGLVLDDGWRIVREYMNKLSQSGQPGVGDAFLKWVLTNMKKPKICEMVPLTPKSSNPDSYEEFPSHSGLKYFDPSDRKFVAVAAAHPEHPPIMQAADSKWWGWKKPLKESGVDVEFLCPDEIQEKYHQKMA